MCLYSWDYTKTYNEKKTKIKIDHIVTTKIDLGLEINTNKVNIKGVSLYSYNINRPRSRN